MKATDTKTAEEILDNLCGLFPSSDNNSVKDNVLRAMEEYASQFKAERPSVTDQPLHEQIERKSAEEFIIFKLKDTINEKLWSNILKDHSAIVFEIEQWLKEYASQPSEVSDTKEDNSFMVCDCDNPEINDANICIRCGGYNRNGF